MLKEGNMMKWILLLNYEEKKIPVSIDEYVYGGTYTEKGKS